MGSGAAGAGVVALFEFDASSFGSFLVSRPFVLGPLIGWALGSPWTGAAQGCAFEFLTLEETPLGGRLDFSAPVGVGVAAWLAAGPAGLPGEAAFVAGLAAGYAHALVEARLRRGRGAVARRAEAELSAGRAPRLGRGLLSTLAAEAAGTFVVAFVALAALGPALLRLWPALPEFLRGGARAGYVAAPWLGAGSLAAGLWRRA